MLLTELHEEFQTIPFTRISDYTFLLLPYRLSYIDCAKLFFRIFYSCCFVLVFVRNGIFTLLLSASTMDIYRSVIIWSYNNSCVLISIETVFLFWIWSISLKFFGRLQSSEQSYITQLLFNDINQKKCNRTCIWNGKNCWAPRINIVYACTINI